ncbi:hypothetical protein M2454_001215 [Aequitasia blattaphilus]|uniref:DUF3784 domain-containing protein n=1 Tax=Aequitasia blattaphilus TaxID=2949332 RepID=A0ABT1E6K8_9FIRM|nr:hypothetical protein [Aequitasia blattaphilus]MCP1101479.1 hypothetical protein [Aequitasia blattaphilus]MCR8614119.1 hypothetical protein [Aequitasia blattaphilus]
MEFFGVITLLCGLYCIYSFYKARVQGNLENYVLLPKNADISKIKNKDEYIRRTSIPLLILGIVVTLAGACDLYNSQTGNLKTLNIILYFVSVFSVIVFLILIRKWTKEFL